MDLPRRLLGFEAHLVAAQTPATTRGGAAIRGPSVGGPRATVLLQRCPGSPRASTDTSTAQEIGGSAAAQVRSRNQQPRPGPSPGGRCPLGAKVSGSGKSPPGSTSNPFLRRVPAAAPPRPAARTARLGQRDALALNRVSGSWPHRTRWVPSTCTVHLEHGGRLGLGVGLPARARPLRQLGAAAGKPPGSCPRVSSYESTWTVPGHSWLSSAFPRTCCTTRRRYGRRTARLPGRRPAVGQRDPDGHARSRSSGRPALRQ